jgi:phage gpG-like protein
VPYVTITPRESDVVDAWAEALELGTTEGLEAGADFLRTNAEESIAAARDPWGVAHAPLSPLTQRLYAQGVEVRGSAADSLQTRRVGERRMRIEVRGRRWYLGFKQWGTSNHIVFHNSEPVTVPARPFLPVRDDGSVDMPPEMRRQLLGLFRRALRDAIVRESVADQQRAVRALRRLR